MTTATVFVEQFTPPAPAAHPVQVRLDEEIAMLAAAIAGAPPGQFRSDAEMRLIVMRQVRDWFQE